MLLKVFSVYDSKVGAYLPPIYLRSKGEAIRSLTTALADSSHQFAKYPEDYTLFDLGEWDDATASFHMLPTPVSVGKAIEFMAVAESQPTMPGNIAAMC
jgi:hypothetical protein